MNDMKRENQLESSIKEKIIQILVEPTTVTEIKNKLKEIKSFGSISYHLKNLIKEGIVIKEKDTKSQGQPTRYKLNSKKVLTRIKNLNEWVNKNTLIYLKFLKDNPLISDNNMLNELEKRGFNRDVMGDRATDSLIKNYSEIYHKITPKGERYIKEHSK
jgi:predicted transcriptional regulator